MRSFLRFARLGVTSFLVLTAVILSLALTTDTSASPQPAGSIIRNIAQVTYFDTERGILVTLESNAVEARISVVPAFEVSGRDVLLLARGALDQFTFRIRNTGNITLEVTPTLSASGAVNLRLNPRLFVDLNGNGVVDAGEPELSEADTLEIATGLYVDVIHTFQVAPGAGPGETFDVTLNASARPIFTTDPDGEGRSLASPAKVLAGLRSFRPRWRSPSRRRCSPAPTRPACSTSWDCATTLTRPSRATPKSTVCRCASTTPS